MRTTITEIDGVLHKPCPQCKRVLPLVEEFWTRNTKRKGGFGGWCKPCRLKHQQGDEKNRERQRRYYERTKARDPEIWPARVNAWRSANRERFREVQRHHVAKRRVRKEAFCDVTLAYELELRRRATHCPLCGLGLTTERYHPQSKEIDHIMPLAAGGTHTVGNIRVICRLCNLKRPKDGSDVTGQVELWGWRGDSSGSSVSGSRDP